MSHATIDVTDVNFGVYETGVVTGSVFFDSNQMNGQEFGESGLGGVSVTITGPYIDENGIEYRTDPNMEPAQAYAAGINYLQDGDGVCYFAAGGFAE